MQTIYLTLISMSIHLQVVKIRNKLKKQQINQARAQGRQKMVQRLSNNYYGCCDEQGEKDIIDSIQAYLADREELPSKDIYSFIQSSPFTFSQEFKNQYTLLVLQHLRKDAHCLLGLSSLLQRCEKVEMVEELNLPEFIELLLEEDASNQAIHAEAVMMVLFNLFEASPKKQEFVVLEQYPSQLARIGYHHYLYMDLMVTLGQHTVLTPSRQCIQAYFSHQLEESLDNRDYYEKVIKLTDFHLAKHTDLELVSKYLHWIQSTFATSELPLPARVTLTSTFLTLFETIDSKSQLAHSLEEHNFFKVMIARYPATADSLALLLLTLTHLEPSERITMTEDNKLIERVLECLRSSFSPQVDFQLLSILVVIFSTDEKYVKEADSLGFRNLLSLCLDSEFVRVLLTAELLVDTWKFDDMI